MVLWRRGGHFHKALKKRKEKKQLDIIDERALRRNTTQRAPKMHMQHSHVAVCTCTVFIGLPIRTKPYQSSEQQVETTG
jgi:hypothetical protein